MKDSIGNVANVALPTPGESGSLSFNKNIIIDTKNPTIAISATNSSNLKINTTTTTNDNPLSFTFTANEPIVGFSVDDIAVTGGSLSSFTAASSTVYNASFVPSSDGKKTIDIPVNGANGWKWK